MTVEQRLERDLPAILGDLAMGPYPDYVEPFLAAAAHRRQRPAWTFPERWLPMDIATRRVAAPGLPWRQLGVLALLALLVVSAVAVYVGSQPRPADPFGLAANGLVADFHDGDIRTIDPTSGAIRPIVTGDDYDAFPVFSRSGAWLAFLRASFDDDLTWPELWAVRPDGSDLTQLTFASLTHVDTFEWTVDERAIIVKSRVDGRMRISLVAADGSGTRTFDDVDIAEHGWLAARPPDGRQVMFNTPADLDGFGGGLSTLDLDTGAVRPIMVPEPSTGLSSGFVWSPLGDRFAYGLAHRDGPIEIHVADADGSNDHVVAHRPGATFEAWPLWSPSGRYLLIERRLLDETVVPVVVDLETGEEVVIATTISHNGATKEWAPDESSILAVRTSEGGVDGSPELWDVATGAVTPVPWEAEGIPTWQRTAP